MRLAYLTTVHVTSSGAQSIQISAMVRAFTRELGSSFCLISPGSCKDVSYFTADIRWYQLKLLHSTIRPIRYIMLLTIGYWYVRKHRATHIFTRDIAVAVWYRFWGYDVTYAAHKQFVTRIGNILFRLVDDRIRVVTNCQALKDHLVLTYSIDPQYVHVAHNGIDVADIIHHSRESKKLSLRPQVVYTGSLQRGKGVDIAVTLAQKVPQVDVILIGVSEYALIDMYSISLPCNLVCQSNRITHKEVMQRLRDADVLLLPNTPEVDAYSVFTSPLKLFEYMASGTPILASRVGSILEILHEENAYLFDPHDIHDAGKKLLDICKNYDKAKQKASIAIEDVLQYTWDIRAHKLVQFIHNKQRYDKKDNEQI